MIIGNKDERPPALVCANCKGVFDAWYWVADEQEWENDTAWWSDPVEPYDQWAFTCSVHCFRQRSKEVEPCSPQSSKGCSCAMRSINCPTP